MGKPEGCRLWELSAASMQSRPVERYPPVGIDEGSKLWEENETVLQGTMYVPNDLDSAHLFPMDGYLGEGKSRAGFL